MPIYGITQRGLRFPRLGTIRKGEQVPVMDSKTGKPKVNTTTGEVTMRPAEKPYWVIHVDPTAQAVLEQIYAAYGTREITELNVFLPLPDAQANFDFWLEAYTASQLVARSDERYVTYLRDIVTGELLIRDSKVIGHSGKPKSAAGALVEDIPLGGSLPYEEGMVVAVTEPSGNKITFKAVGRLQVVIRELGRLATFTVMTGSYWYDIPKIFSALELTEQIANASGRPANTIPLLLRRVPIEVAFTDKDNKKKRGVKWFIELEPVSDVVGGLLQAYAGTPFAFAISGREALPIPEDEAYNEEADEADPEVIDATPEPPAVEKTATGAVLHGPAGSGGSGKAEKPKGKAKLLPRPEAPAENNGPVVTFVVPGNRSWPTATIKAVIENGFAENEFAARGMLNLSNLAIGTPDEVLFGWCDLYRQKRPRKGTNLANAPTSAEAADFANKGIFERWGGAVAQAVALGGVAIPEPPEPPEDPGYPGY